MAAARLHAAGKFANSGEMDAARKKAGNGRCGTGLSVEEAQLASNRAEYILMSAMTEADWACL